MAIREAGYIAMLGQIVDSSLISAPKQRKINQSKVTSEIWPDAQTRRARKIPLPVGLSGPARCERSMMAGFCRSLPSLHSATRCTARLTEPTALSRNGMSAVWSDMTDACCGKGCWTRPTLVQAYGPTAPFVQTATRPSSQGTGMSPHLSQEATKQADAEEHQASWQYLAIKALCANRACLCGAE